MFDTIVIFIIPYCVFTNKIENFKISGGLSSAMLKSVVLTVSGDFIVKISENERLTINRLSYNYMQAIGIDS